MQYSNFSVILGSLITLTLTLTLLAVFPPQPPPPPSPYAKFWIHASNTVYGVRERGGPV